MATRLFLIIALLLPALYSTAQQQEIVSILNKQWKQETKYWQSNPELNQDSLSLVQPFTIKGNVLSFTVQKWSYYDGLYREKQEIALDKITAIIKDIYVIFETVPDAVKITRTLKDGSQNHSTSDLFRLHLSHEKGNEYLADQLIKAFSKAGLTLKKDVWYD